MKLFWAIIVLFIAGAGFVTFVQSRPNDVVRQVATETLQPQETVGELIVDSPLFAPVDEDADDFDSATGTQATDDAEDIARQLEQELLASSQQPWRDDDGEFDYADWPRSGSSSGAGGHQHQSIQQAENPWAQEGELALGDERLAAQRLQHSIVQQDDGSLLLDETFVIRGEGTAASPYEITWDLLMSAAETYQPRLGMENIPKRIAMLDGKHVKISGHLMFPMITGQADELLVMLNMWDGCCIGTMPSPYDAIEVQLGTPTSLANQQFFNYGTIEGTLSIDPYLINDWLIGLYLMEDARLHVGM